MNAYKKFSYFYDEVMQNLDYYLWSEFTEQFAKPNDSILDLACGSGTFLTIMNLHGYKTTGLDLSASIIEIAQEKAKLNRLNIPFYVMDMTSFTLSEQFDIITCYFDSINFVENKNKLKNLFSQVRKHLKPGGYFLFDTFSKFMLEEYKNNLLDEDYQTFKIKWKTTATSSKKIMHDIEINDYDEIYREKYYEYYYDFQDFDLTGFEVVKIVGDFNDDLETDDERILYALRKK